MYALAVQLKPPEQHSVGPQRSSFCVLTPCTQWFFFPHSTLSCLLVLKMSLFSIFSMSVSQNSQEVTSREWQCLSFLTTFFLTNWDNNSSSKDNSSQLYGNTWACQGRNVSLHRLRHTATWAWQQPPTASYSGLAERFSCSLAVGIPGDAQCLRNVPVCESLAKSPAESFQNCSTQCFSF